jgi:hypothetical protein
MSDKKVYRPRIKDLVKNGLIEPPKRLCQTLNSGSVIVTVKNNKEEKYVGGVKFPKI